MLAGAGDKKGVAVGVGEGRVVKVGTRVRVPTIETGVWVGSTLDVADTGTHAVTTRTKTANAPSERRHPLESFSIWIQYKLKLPDVQ